ncbi:uncharacterized protein, YigZ family [compost metagenome]
MLFDDTYKTIKGTSEGIFRDRGSKFIGYAFPIRHEEEIKEMIVRLRSEHPKARHFCWALRLTPDRSIFRINDDGEPSGSAGRPILNTLLSAGLTNVLLVVVRYFGGTLLGVPGLINAYKQAAIAAIGSNEVILKTINDTYELRFDYLQMNEVMRIIKEEQLSIVTQQFNNQCSIQLEIRKGQLDSALNKFHKLQDIEVKFLYTS